MSHFKAIADAVRIPIVVYSVQGRTGVNVEPATPEGATAALDALRDKSISSFYLFQFLSLVFKISGSRTVAEKSELSLSER